MNHRTNRLHFSADDCNFCANIIFETDELQRFVPPCIALSRGVLSTGPGRDHAGKTSCLTGSICFQLLCICMALAGRPPQPCCTCGGFRCICIDIAVVEDSLAELDLYPPPCLFGMLGICKAVSTFFDCLSRSAGPSKKNK